MVAIGPAVRLRQDKASGEAALAAVCTENSIPQKMGLTRVVYPNWPVPLGDSQSGR